MYVSLPSSPNNEVSDFVSLLFEFPSHSPWWLVGSPAMLMIKSSWEPLRSRTEGSLQNTPCWCLNRLHVVWEGECASYSRAEVSDALGILATSHDSAGRPVSCFQNISTISSLLALRSGCRVPGTSMRAHESRAWPFPSDWWLTPSLCRGDRVMYVKV